MRNKYSIHEVAVILANAFGDDCACNFNDNDEWLPMVCDFRDTVCPNPCRAACWEQYLKHNPKLLKEIEPVKKRKEVQNELDKNNRQLTG